MENKKSKFYERYGGLMGHNEYPVSDAVESIISRTTIRFYDKDKPIPDDLFQKLICAAQSAPTSSMAQAWSVVSIKDKKTKLDFITNPEFTEHLGISSKVDPLNKLAIGTCDRLLIWLVDLHRLKLIFDNEQVHQYLNDKKQDAKDGLDLMHYELRSIIDTSIAAQTFALSAELEGLGVMFCGSFRTLNLKKILNLPDYVIPLFGMTVGYPFPTYVRSKPKPRLPQNLVVHEENYKDVDFNLMSLYNQTVVNEYYTKTPWADNTDWFEKMILRTLPHNLNINYKNLISQQGFRFK